MFDFSQLYLNRKNETIKCVSKYVLVIHGQQYCDNIVYYVGLICLGLVTFKQYQSKVSNLFRNNKDFFFIGKETWALLSNGL